MHSELVNQILEIINESIQMVENRFEEINDPENFVFSEDGVTLLDAISMRLQVIGEQIKKLEKIAPEVIKSRPEIQWKKIMKLRDLISHHYDQIDHEIVFDICENHLPKLKDVIQTVLRNE